MTNYLLSTTTRHNLVTKWWCLWLCYNNNTKLSN